ncbi:MAG: lytic transglycosylase domain-containing protein [Alphaproteobacteria bacterium]|nr:lytic transglycosylase domain-containing protein [Alphaproteobacteria bacterium]
MAQWAALRRGAIYGFSSYANFLLVHKDWPAEAQLRAAAERSIRPGVDSPALIISFFRAYPPQTPSAWLRFAEALLSLGQAQLAIQAARSAWTSGLLSADDETRLMSRFATQLTAQDQDQRMDKLLWLRATSAAVRQLPFTSTARRPSFEVRLALLTKAPDAPDRLAYATSPVRLDPGFIADYMWWLRSTGQSGVARQILRFNMPMSAYPASPDVWLQMLLLSAQDAAKDNEWQLAYDIASRIVSAYPPGTAVRDRPFAERDAYTDLSWLGATAALNRLNMPENAAALFTLYAGAAKSPQTQARGWYWAGRSWLAAGKPVAAQSAFENAARFSDQFHGQLAAERLGRLPDVSHDAITVAVTAQDRAAFLNRSVVRAMLSLGKAGNWTEQSLFVRSIANAVSTDAEHILASELAAQAGRPDLNVLVGRNARNSGLSGYMRTAFPQIDVPADHVSNWSIIHAISRQESQFDRAATSRVGARGLMQLMPATARATAPRAGLSYSENQLTDPVYNMTLGSTYFGRLMDQYNGSYVLAIAAYNAGPGNVNRWLRTIGDPRDDRDVLEWIEAIPFSETRNYVQRVLENAVVYDALNPARATVRSSTPLSTYLGKRYPG